MTFFGLLFGGSLEPITFESKFYIIVCFYGKTLEFVCVSVTSCRWHSNMIVLLF